MRLFPPLIANCPLLHLPRFLTAQIWACAFGGPPSMQFTVERTRLGPWGAPGADRGVTPIPGFVTRPR